MCTGQRALCRQLYILFPSKAVCDYMSVAIQTRNQTILFLNNLENCSLVFPHVQWQCTNTVFENTFTLYGLSIPICDWIDTKWVSMRTGQYHGPTPSITVTSWLVATGYLPCFDTTWMTGEWPPAAVAAGVIQLNWPQFHIYICRVYHQINVYYIETIQHEHKNRNSWCYLFKLKAIEISGIAIKANKSIG